MYKEQSGSVSYSDNDNAMMGYPMNNPKVSETPRILAEYGGLSEGLKMLSDTFDRLRAQLEPITGPSRPTAGVDGSKNPDTSLSPLAESIRCEAASVYRINSAMRDLLERIEV